VGAIVAGVIGLLLAAALVNTLRSDGAREQTRDALLTRIAALSESVDVSQGQLDEQATAVDALQSQLLDSTAAEQAAERLAGLADQAATTPLTGPGLVVSIADAPDASEGSLNRVLDRDLQDIANVLWQMGAVGIAINEQRLTSTTAIRSAGDAILVNYQPLSPPYEVTAIGTTTSGESDSGLQVLLSGLSEDYGLVTGIETGDVALPAGGLRYPRFATTGDGEGGQ
jgi:uncharacterized protein YlxW (UPF0749 family)